MVVLGKPRTAAPLPLAPVFNPRLVAQVTPSRTTALVTTPATSRRPLITTTTQDRRLQTTSKPAPFEPFKPSRKFVEKNVNTSDIKNLLSCDFEVTSASDQGCGVR